MKLNLLLAITASLLITGCQVTIEGQRKVTSPNVRSLTLMVV